MLKALFVVKNNQHPPYSHNLGLLARQIGLELSKERAKAVDLVTSFNLEARYPDEKRKFRALCTPEYTQKQMALIKELYQWLRSHLK